MHDALSQLHSPALTRRAALGKIGTLAGGLSLATMSGLVSSGVSLAADGGDAATPPPDASPAPAAAAKARRPPNVVVFFTDQQRWDTTGASGNKLGLTPNFDRMAARGAYLPNYFSCQPVCGPARSCLQTGLFATQTGVWHNGPALNPDYPDTLAKLFHKGGYDTGYIGKWHLGGVGARPTPAERRGGFDYWWASDVLESTTDAYGGTVWDSDSQPVHPVGYRADALTDTAVKYLSNHAGGDKPFLLFISYLEPHHQNSRDDYPAPDVYQETYRGKWTPPDLAHFPSVVPNDPNCAQRCLPGYLGMIKRLDECLGRVQDALKSLGLDNNTVVIYTSDHGNHFKTRNHEYKRSCHEASIRLPGAIQGPGFDGAGALANLVSLVDLPPTILDAAGLPVPPQMQGKAIGAHLRGEQKDWPDDVYIQISESQTGRAVRTLKWKYGVNSLSRQTGKPAANAYVEQYLYDLENDPYEINNLAGQPQYEAVAADMQARLKRWMEKAGEPAATIQRAA